MRWQTSLLTVAAALAAYLGLTLVSLGRPCGGSGGSPYAASGSPAGRFCDHGGPLFVVGLPVAAALLALALRRRSGTWSTAVWLTFAAGVVAEVLLAAWARRLSLES